MCVQVQTTPATFTEAEAICAQDNARLASFQSCSQFVGLYNHLWSRYPVQTNRYWIGAYALAFDRFGSDGLKTVQEGPNNNCDAQWDVEYSLDGTSVTGALTISENGFYGQMVHKADGTAMIMSHEYDKQDASTPSSFLCEKDESWACPDGFIMYQKLCYELNVDEVVHAEAEHSCSSRGGKLLDIENRMQHMFITAAFPQSQFNHNSTWLNIQKLTNGPADSLWFSIDAVLIDFKFDSSSPTDYTSANQADADDENCVVLDVTDATVTNAFKKVSCQQNASFICQYPLGLSSHLSKIMPELQLFMPLDKASGIKDLALPARVNTEEMLSMTEEVILDSGLIGAASFMGSATSYIDIENTGEGKEMKSSFGLSVSMWIWLSGFAMFDYEEQMLIDTRAECDDGLTPSEGFRMYLTKTPATHTVAPFNHDACGLIYNNSLNDVPSGGLDPSNEIRVNVELCSKEGDDTILCSLVASAKAVPTFQWAHIGFTFDDISKKGTFFIGESYGYTNMTDASVHEVEYFKFDSKGWWSQHAVNTHIRLGSSKFQASPGQKNFAGKMSCLQIYEGPLALAHFIGFQKCPVKETYPMVASHCPEGYDYYKGYCYRLSQSREEFATAEGSCVSEAGTVGCRKIVCVLKKIFKPKNPSKFCFFSSAKVLRKFRKAEEFR